MASTFIALLRYSYFWASLAIVERLVKKNFKNQGEKWVSKHLLTWTWGFGLQCQLLFDPIHPFLICRRDVEASKLTSLPIASQKLTGWEQVATISSALLKCGVPIVSSCARKAQSLRKNGDLFVYGFNSPNRFCSSRCNLIVLSKVSQMLKGERQRKANKLW